MKSLRLLVVLILLVSLTLLFLSGCAKKEEVETAPETEQLEEAPVDTIPPPPPPEGEVEEEAPQGTIE
ncbi:MAG: hypothetical protein SCK70_06065 [bacterium]|nr:hypothetical protein [bacterium]